MLYAEILQLLMGAALLFFIQFKLELSLAIVVQHQLFDCRIFQDYRKATANLS